MNVAHVRRTQLNPWETMVLVMYFNGCLLSPSVTMCCKCDTQFMQASFTLVPPVSSTIHRDFTARKPDRAGPTKHNKNMNAENIHIFVAIELINNTKYCL
jgi:hypothetical protein